MLYKLTCEKFNVEILVYFTLRLIRKRLRDVVEVPSEHKISYQTLGERFI